MRLLLLLLASLFALATARTLVKKSADLYFRDVDGDGKGTHFASVEYPISPGFPNPDYVELSTASSIPGGVVQVGVVDSKTGTLKGGVVKGNIFSNKDGYKPVIRLYIDRAGDVYYADVSGERSEKTRVIVAQDPPGATPLLHRPIPLDKDGKIPVPTQEKTFLQKYWWLILAVAVFVIGGGGGGE